MLPTPLFKDNAPPIESLVNSFESPDIIVISPPSFEPLLPVEILIAPDVSDNESPELIDRTPEDWLEDPLYI